MLEIRTAVAEDLASVRAVLVETWHATYDAIYGPERVTAITDSWHALETLQRQLVSGLSQRLVALVDGRIVATASARIDHERIVKLHQLYVLPDAQGRGIGKALLAATLSQFSEASRVTLEFAPQNATAIAFYEQQGFQQTGTITDCGQAGSGISAIVYERMLERSHSDPQRQCPH